MSVRKQKPRPLCYWTQEFVGYEGEQWRTDCDNLFDTASGGPIEFGFKFCPHCGQPIKVKP